MSTVQILLHMNKDHKTSLHDYLEYYGGVHVDVNSSDRVELVDVKLNEITIDYTKGGASKSVVIPLNPPMSTMQDARDRFIKMAFEAAKGLHVSPYRFTEYVWPKTVSGYLKLYGLGSGLIGLGVLGFSKKIATRLGWLSRVPWLRALLLVVLSIHMSEYLYFAVPLLRRFRAPTSLYLKYLLATMLSGFAGWLPLKHEAARLDAKSSQ